MTITLLTNPSIFVDIMSFQPFTLSGSTGNLPYAAIFGVCVWTPLKPMLWDMSKRLYNWNYRNVVGFLKEKGFSFDKELGGSHQAWIKRGDNGGPDRRVEVNFTHGSYPVLTLKTMIRQSGIGAKEWIKWASS